MCTQYAANRYCQIAFAVVVGLWVTGCIRDDAVAVKSCGAQCASSGRRTASGGTGGATGGAGGRGTSGSSGVNTNAAGSGGPRDAGISGVNEDAAGYGGRGAGGTATTDANNGIDLGNCQLTCDAKGAACAGMCIANSDDRRACENACLETAKSCGAQCTPSVNGGDSASCRLTCGTEEGSCTSLCISYSDPYVNQACHEHCVDNGNTCEAHC
jgi:hypothetical protein